jgi:hypothetical protein
MLAPSEKKILSAERSIKMPQKTMAQAHGLPSFDDGTEIPTCSNVMDEDDAAVGMTAFAPEIKVENTVYAGVDGGNQCGTAVAGETVKGIHGTRVIHCFKVTNMGNAYLSGVQLRNKELGDYINKFERVLAPQQTWQFALPSNITATLINTATVDGQPAFMSGAPIPGMGRVSASDPAGVVKESFSAEIDIQNTVYLGKDDGAKCGSPEAVEFVSDFFGSDVVYCFKVTNKGSSHLASIAISNEALSFKDASIGTLAPGQSAIVSHDGQITKDLKNVAVVKANPVTSDGRDIPIWRILWTKTLLPLDEKRMMQRSRSTHWSTWVTTVSSHVLERRIWWKAIAAML